MHRGTSEPHSVLQSVMCSTDQSSQDRYLVECSKVGGAPRSRSPGDGAAKSSFRRGQHRRVGGVGRDTVVILQPGTKDQTA